MKTVLVSAVAALLLVGVAGGPLSAQPDNVSPESSLPTSTTDSPMEALWDRAPETAQGQFPDVGPYLVSRWGGIVIRGKRDGDRIVTALNIMHCGDADNPATDITVIGVAPQSLCDGIKPVSPGNAQTVSGDGYTLYGTANGWTVVDFAQTISGDVTDFTISDGLEPAPIGGSYGVTHFGAAYRDENGRHLFYAPGETVDLGHGVTFVVKPTMQKSDLDSVFVEGAMREMSDGAIVHSTKTKSKPPLWFMVLFFGLPLAAIGGVIYGLRRWIVGRKALKTVQPVDPTSGH